MQLSGLLLLLVVSEAGQDERGVDDLITKTPGQVAAPTSATRTVVNAIPVIQRTVVSSARVDDLKTYFTEAYKKAGLFIAPVQEKFKPMKGEQVTALDTENLIAYMAMFQPSGKYTTVVIAAANMGQPKLQRGSEVIAPVFPGGHSVTSYNIEMVQGMTYTCSGTPAEIKKFYRDEFAKAGYQETDELVFVKDHTRAWITVAPGVNERGVAVYLQNAPDPNKPMAMPTPMPAPAPAKPAPAASKGAAPK